MPDVLVLVRTQVGTGPLGPVRVATAPLSADGIKAISGRPTVRPPHPQNVRGSGDSAMKRVRLVVEPSPGNTTGEVGFGAALSMPRTTSSVAAERHCVLVGFGGLAHMPNPALRNDGRSTPMAWNGPVIQRSTWDRTVAPASLDTATLPLLPAVSPLVV